jgi:hypothetical protein
MSTKDLIGELLALHLLNKCSISRKRQRGPDHQLVDSGGGAEDVTAASNLA